MLFGDVLVERWTPMDGDTIVTKEGFIFCVFGYEHPNRVAFSFLKYVPSQLKTLFSVRFLKRKWVFRGVELVRPEKLYTAKNYQETLETFRSHFPHYIYLCPFYGKEIASSPTQFIKKVYTPMDCLQELLQQKEKDQLQKLAVELATLLSEESGVSIEEFGIRGSIALNMHTTGSDIDLAVYGAENFRDVESTVSRLNDEGTLSHIFSTELDQFRKFRGRYKNTLFMLSAVRKSEEINHSYGEYQYHPVRPVSFRCHVTDDCEAIFKPAIYKVTDYQPFGLRSQLADKETPTRVVSMIGCYRNVARKGEKIRVSGTLEKVKNIETGAIHYQVVVGTGMHEDEYIWPIPS
jgi:predicted nucleotidyltransferase